MLKTFRFDLPKVSCAACAALIEATFENKILPLKDSEKKITVKSFSASIPRRQLIITVDDDDLPEALVEKNILAALDDNAVDAVPRGTQKSFIRRHIFKGMLGIVSGIGFLALSIFSGGLPLLATYILTGVSTMLSLYLGKESFVETYIRITKTRTLEMSALYSASAITAITVSIASLFVPWLPGMLDAALLIFGFRNLGIAIEEKAGQEVTAGLSFQESVASTIEVKEGDEFVQRDLGKIKVGDIIRVLPEQTIPLDGNAISKDGLVNTKIFNGAIAAQTITNGASLIAGMIVKSNEPLLIEVTHKKAQSYLAQLDAKIELAEHEKEKAPLQTYAEKVLAWFVPGVFMIATAAAIGVSLLLNPVLAIQFATSLLVSACPCTLGSIVPLAVTVGIAKAAHHGVLFKNGKAVQAAAQTNIVIFDLNGTLTEGDYQVENVKFFDTECDRDDVLACLYKLEENSTHAVGVAIRTYLEKNYKSAAMNRKIEPVSTSHHAGSQLLIDNKHFAIGNIKMMEDAGIDVSPYRLLNGSDQRVFFARDQQLVGYITLKDPLRPEAPMVVDALIKQGKDVRICTGADLATAQHYAEALNIPFDNVIADCNSHDKAAYITALKAEKNLVAMIGDAENDALPLTQSNLGIFIKSDILKADKSEEQANVIIQKSSLLPVLSAFTIGKQTVKNIHQNLVISFAYNFTTLSLTAGLLFGVGFALNPAVGVALMIMQASMVLLNVYRFKKTSVLGTSARVIPAPQPKLNHTAKILQELSYTNGNTKDYQVEPEVLPTPQPPKLTVVDVVATVKPEEPVNGRAYRMN